MSKKKGKLTLEKLFKILSNQKRLEILMAVFENYQSASEVAQIVGLDVSTTYRYLVSMKSVGILNSRKEKGLELFDFSTPEIYKILELAVEFVKRANLQNSENNSGILKEVSPDKIFQTVELSDVKPDYILDMRGELCPIPDLTTRKVVSQLEEGKILKVIVDYPLSAERIPNSMRKLGHQVLGKVTNDRGETAIYIRISRSQSSNDILGKE